MRACRRSTTLKDITVVVRLCLAPVVVVLLQLGAGCVAGAGGTPSGQEPSRWNGSFVGSTYRLTTVGGRPLPIGPLEDKTPEIRIERGSLTFIAKDRVHVLIAGQLPVLQERPCWFL